MKEVLVSGGAGFIGSHLVEELSKNKNYKITVIDDLSAGNLANLVKLYDEIDFYLEKIQNFTFPIKFDIIYHLAAKINARDKCLAILENNVMATEAVVKLLKPDGHICFSSSCAVYGNQAYVTEKSNLKPINLYGYSKWMNELTIKVNCKNYTIFRFGNVFGERQDGSDEIGLVAVIAHNLKNNTTMSVFNQGENNRDYVYVKDVVSALIKIKEKGVFQIGNCKEYNTLDLVKLSGVKWAYGVYNDNEMATIKLDNTKIKKLGWNSTLKVTKFIQKMKKEANHGK